MAVISVLSQKPLLLGLQHFGLGLLGLGAATGIGAGAVQIVGNPADAGPKVEMSVPVYHPPENPHDNHAPREVTNTIPEQTGLLAMLPWIQPNAAMTPINAAQAGHSLPDLHAPIPEESAHAGEPKVISVAEAASAAPSQYSGDARILAPTNAMSTTTEAGVRVTRGGTSGGALAAAPIAGVHQQGPNGLLPIIGSDGRTPFDVYKRPAGAASNKKIALVVGGLGLNARITERAINQLPAEVTLSFVPYADNLQGWINRARASGHEVLIEIPMEPFDFPDNDTGPQTLLAGGNADENQRRLEYLLSRASGYFGVVNYLGGKFAANASASAAFMHSLKARGLGFIGDGSYANLGSVAHNNGVKSVNADRSIDQRPSAADINAQLGALEALAGQKGYALGFGVAYSVTIDQINSWLSSASARGVTLVPASSVAS